jgi:DNA repair protein RecN (Recombination protein N)
MLCDLIIKNFAIVEQLQVNFNPGFNVLTGETGAGKSIIIDAVNLLLGGRARGEVIRTGTEEATVEAVFDLDTNSVLQQRLAEMGLDNGPELLVRRIVARNGKNRIFVNGSAVPLAQLREITPLLVNIYGQHEHQGLQRVETHLPLLDSYAGCQAEAAAYLLAYESKREIYAKLQRLELAERERQQRLDMLSFQRQEIAAADLQPGEDDLLEQERLLLKHAGRLSEATNGGYRTLYAGTGAVCEQLSSVASSLSELQQIDPQLAELGEALKSAHYTIEDVALQLRDYAQKISFEPQRQQQVEDRLAQIKTLKRKYAPTVAELLEFLQRLDAELDELRDIDGHRDQLQQQLNEAEVLLVDKGRLLSAKRSAAATRLAQLVERELADLAMTNTRFEVRLVPLETPTADGLEAGEFYLAANAGESAQPLARIASGGELSRIMLALRRSIPAGDMVHTLIFDEVDAGIGGEAATAVGEKICRLGEELQVLCVTHLPQVAAFAHHHFQVFKQEAEGRTRTGLTPLQGEERVHEMARMLGGAQVTERTIDHARELLIRG